MITFLQGDACEQLSTLPDQSVQTVVTSPPYWGLRKYTDDVREIGREPTPADYVAALVAVFNQVWRVLRDDGTLWINLGDSYSQSSTYQATRTMHTDAGWKQADENRDFKLNAKNTGIAPKNLIGIPWRVAFALQDAGWILRSDIIWAKPNCMPESVTDRPTRSHEYLFLFAKQARYFYDAAAIAEKTSDKTHWTYPQPDKAARAGQTTNGTGASTLRGKGGKNAFRGQGANRDGRDMQDVGAGPTRNKRTVWTIATKPYSEAHFATMPEALIEPCILAGSQAGDTVLDPFVGSGTVARVCARLQRSCIGIDLAYQELQQKRTDTVQVELFV